MPINKVDFKMMAMMEQQPLDLKPVISSGENIMQQVSSVGINGLSGSTSNLIPSAATLLMNDTTAYMQPPYMFTNRFPFAAGILNGGVVSDLATTAAAVAMSSLGQLQQTSTGSSNGSPGLG